MNAEFVPYPSPLFGDDGTVTAQLNSRLDNIQADLIDANGNSVLGQETKFQLEATSVPVNGSRQSSDLLNLAAWKSSERRGLSSQGGAFVFFGGAGDQGEYLQTLQNAFDDAEIKGAYVMNAGSKGDNWPGVVLDLANLPLINDLTFAATLAAVPPQAIRNMVATSQKLAANDQQFNIGG